MSISVWGSWLRYLLKKLDLSGCGLTKAPEFDYPNELEELNLSNNPLNDSIISIWRKWSLHSLKKLDLSGCGLTKTPEFDNLHRLEELNLSNNPLNDSTISIEGKWPLHSLRNLDLSGCGLTEAPKFDYLHRLEELNLSNNHIDHQDLLQKLNRETASCMSDLQIPLKHEGMFLRRIKFEDGAYIYSQFRGG